MIWNSLVFAGIIDLHSVTLRDRGGMIDAGAVIFLGKFQGH
jgi:hypothetical protein